MARLCRPPVPERRHTRGAAERRPGGACGPQVTRIRGPRGESRACQALVTPWVHQAVHGADAQPGNSQMTAQSSISRHLPTCRATRLHSRDGHPPPSSHSCRGLQKTMKLCSAFSSESAAPGGSCTFLSSRSCTEPGTPSFPKRSTWRNTASVYSHSSSALPPPALEATTAAEPPCQSGSNRVYLVSDLHTDYPENMAWVEALGRRQGHGEDALIVAGDVSDDLQTIRRTLGALRAAFGRVFFVPGNHELWCRDPRGPQSSLAKLEAVLDSCRQLGVETSAGVVGAALIVPMLSWYHASFDHEADLPLDLLPLQSTCKDFRACRWDAGLTATGTVLAEHLDALNDTLRISDIPHWVSLQGIQQVITVSHFLPRLELCPEKRVLLHPDLAKVSGSHFLEARIRAVHRRCATSGGPKGLGCHVFGHTHFRWDMTLEGIRYFQASLGYPKERQRSGYPKDWLPLLLYSPEHGLPHQRNHGHWSGHYANNPRDPSDLELAPWVARRYRNRMLVGKEPRTASL